MKIGTSRFPDAMRRPPTTVLALFGMRHTSEFTALAKLRWSGSTIPIRYESMRGADMFMRDARTMYTAPAETALRVSTRPSMKIVESAWVVAMARTLPQRRARRELPIAANPIVRLEIPRSGPLNESGAANFRKSHVGMSGMMNPAPRPMRPLYTENLDRRRRFRPRKKRFSVDGAS